MKRALLVLTWFLWCGNTLAVVKAAADATLDDRDIVQHAGGVIEIRPPLNWHVNEFSVGREIRLVITPGPVRHANISEGLWLTIHVVDDPAVVDVDRLKTMLASRIPILDNRAVATGQPKQDSIAGAVVVSQTFRSTKSNSDTDPAKTQLRGFHLLAKVPQGIVEIYGVAPDDRYQQRSREFAQTLADMSFNETATMLGDVHKSAADAKPILGAWKSYRGRLKLNEKGRIMIKSDVPMRVAKFTSPQTEKSAPPITGRFEAHDDLLFVTWDDGSRLNFRWRLEGASLLLTDHDGQISQLRRILE